MSERITKLIKKMTIEQKIGQLLQRGEGFVIEKCDLQYENTRNGMISAHPDMNDVKINNEIQRVAVEESELGIPLVFGIDVIHGYRTMFPIPYAETMSFEPKLAEETAAAAAKEAAANGVKWTYGPMVDISRNPHWGRVCEGSGEDPYVGSVFAAARVKGFQGDDPSAPDRIGACVKHFAGYGFCEGGRDYNSVDISESKMYNVVLPPFRAAVDAGAISVMSAFHDMNGEACTCSKWLLTNLLRDELGFDGMVISDCNAVKDLLRQGCVKDEREAALRTIEAGVDMDMASSILKDNIKGLIEDGSLPMEVLDRAVERVLVFKERLGAFDTPYFDEESAKKAVLTPEHLELSRRSGARSVALLKHSILPISNKKKIALIGPMADNKEELLGEWCCSGRADECITLYQAMSEEADVIYAKGCDFDSDDTAGFEAAIEAAQKSDVVVAMIGQSRDICGESKSRADLGITGRQTELIAELKKTGKPVVVIVMSGRPIVMNEVYELADDLLYTGALGTMGGYAFCDVLFGRYNPAARLIMNMPFHNTSAHTTYYAHTNTCRPYTLNSNYCSRYIDSSSEPLLPFGYGLSYTSFEYSGLKIEKPDLKRNETLKCSVDVTNTGDYDGEEVVQLYITDCYAKEVRPVIELKGFDKKMIRKGETVRFNFEIPVEKLGYYDRKLNYCVEPGEFELHAGGNSVEYITEKFCVIE